jgi:hypothetical protein
MPVSAQVRSIAGDDHDVAETFGDLLLAARAEVGLASLVGLDRHDVDPLVEWFGAHEASMPGRLAGHGGASSPRLPCSKQSLGGAGGSSKSRIDRRG